MKPRKFLLIAGVAIAAWFAFFGDKTPAGDIAEPVIRTASAPAPAATSQSKSLPAAAAPAGGAERTQPLLDLQARDTFIQDGRNVKRVETLFNSQSWTPPPPPPSKMKMLPPPPPTAPPLPFIFLGKKIEDGAWEVYLGRGDLTFIVREKSVIEGRYQVDAIIPPTLSLTYLPLKQVQRISIGGTD